MVPVTILPSILCAGELVVTDTFGISLHHSFKTKTLMPAMELDAEHPAILLDLVLKPLRLSICAARNCESLTEDAISCRNLCVS